MATVDFTTLGIDIEVNGAAQAERSLDGVAKAGAKVEQQVTKTGAETKKYNDVLKNKVDALDQLQGKLQSVSSGGLSGLSNALSLVSSASSASMVAIAGVGAVVGVAVTSMMLFTKSVLESVDALDEQAKQAGTTIENWMAFKRLGEEAGVGADLMAKNIAKISVQLAELEVKGNKAASMWKQLGINVSASSDPAKVMLDTLEQISRLTGDSQKLLALKEIFDPKSARMLLPLLGDIKGNYAEIMEQMKAAGAVPSDNLIQKSGEWEKATNKVKTAVDGIKLSLANNEMATAMTWFIDKLGDALIKAQGINAQLKEAIRSFSEKGWSMLGMSPTDVRNGLGMGPQVPGTRERSGPIGGIPQPPAVVVKSSEQLEQEAQARIKSLAELTKRNNELAAANEMVRRTEIELASAMNTAQGEFTETDKLLKDMQINQKQWNLQSEETKTRVLATAVAVDQNRIATEKSKKATDDIKKAMEAGAAAYEKYRQSNIDSIAEINKQTERQQIANATFGQGESAVIAYTVAELERQVAIAEGIPGEQASVEALRERIKALKDLQKATKEGEDLEANKKSADKFVREQRDAQDQIWKDAERMANTFFEDLFDNGTKAFKNLGNSLKKYFINILYEMTLKKWLVPITATITGGGAGGAGANPLGGGGGGFDLMSLLGLGGGGGGFDILGMLGLPSLATSFATVGSALSGFGISLAAGADVFLAASSAFALAGTALIPVVGAIAAIGFMLYQAFKKPGGPKQGGYGATDGFTAGGDNNRFFTPNQHDKEMQELANSVDKSYNDLYKTFGGTGDSKGEFAFGFDTDPEGTANDRVSSGAYVNGKEVYRRRDIDVGRGDEEAIKKALDLESKRALLAALQNSELPDDISKILNSVKVETAEAKDIENVIAYAGAVKTINDALDKDMIVEAQKALDEAALSTTEKLAKQSEALLDLGKDFDKTAESSKKIAEATQQYYNNVIATIAAIMQLKTQISDMFKSSREKWAFEVAGQGPNGKTNQTDILDKKLYQLNEDLKNAKSAEEVARITADINRVMDQMWNLLSDEEKKKQLDDYDKKAKEYEATAQKKLQEIQDALQKQADETLQKLHDLLMPAAEKQDKAAIQQKEAADTFSAAVTRMPRELTVIVKNANGTEVGGS